MKALVASLISTIVILTFSNPAQAAGPRYGLKCFVRTVLVDEKDHCQALLGCGSELVNVGTKSALKSAVLVAAKQSGKELTFDVQGSTQGNILEIESIYLP